MDACQTFFASSVSKWFLSSEAPAVFSVLFMCGKLAGEKGNTQLEIYSPVHLRRHSLTIASS